MTKINKQVMAVFFIRCSATTAFALFFSGLYLYLTSYLHIDGGLSATITAVFLAFNYILPLVGGELASRWVSYKILYSLGTLVGAAGCLVLSYTSQHFLGLSFFLMSSLVTSVCLNMIITQAFSEENKVARRVAFTWSYVGMNVGFLLGFALTGYFSLNDKYSSLFNIMAFFLVLSVIIAVLFLEEPRVSRKLFAPAWRQVAICLGFMALAIWVLENIFYHVMVIGGFLDILTIVLFLFVLYWTLLKGNAENRKNHIVFICYLLVSTFFWTIYMLTPIAIMKIIYLDVNRHIFGVLLAPQWIQNANSIAILILGPLLAYAMNRRKGSLNKDSDISTYLTFGLFFMAISCAVLTAGFYFENTGLLIWFVLGYLFLMTLGEMLINPASNSLVGELVSEDVRGQSMGLIKMNMGVSAMLAGFISKKIILPYVQPGGVSPALSHAFLLLTVIVCGVVVMAVFLVGKIKSFTYKDEECYNPANS